MKNEISQTEQIRLLKEQSSETMLVVNNLRKYLNSTKFHCNSELDNYVNISDVISYLDEIRKIDLNNII